MPGISRLPPGHVDLLSSQNEENGRPNASSASLASGTSRASGGSSTAQSFYSLPNGSRGSGGSSTSQSFYSLPNGSGASIASDATHSSHVSHESSASNRSSASGESQGSNASNGPGASGESHESSASHESHESTATPTSQVSSASNTSEAQRQQQIAQISTQLREYFPGSEELNDLIQNRSTELHEMGETPQSIAANMAKAQKMDYISDAAGGAVKAFPFAVSGFASGAVKLGLGIDGTTPGTEALAGAVDGGTAMVLKSVGDKVFADTVKDSQWLAADADKLEPAMQNVLKQREGLGESMKLAPLGGLGFTGRNLVTSTAAVASKNNPAVISNLNNVLSLGAGAAGNVLTNAASATRGPEFLFGRTDWKERYTALNNTSVSHQMVSGGVDRAKTLVGSLFTPKNYAKGALNIASGNMVSEIGTLAAGIAGTNAVRNIVRNSPAHGPLSTASSATIDAITGRLSAAQLTSRGEIAEDAYLNAALSGVAYAAQGVAGALAGPAPTRNDEWVDKKASELANSKLGQGVGKVVDNTIGRVATSSRQWQAEQRRSQIERNTDNIEMQPQGNMPAEG